MSKEEKILKIINLVRKMNDNEIKEIYSFIISYKKES